MSRLVPTRLAVALSLVVCGYVTTGCGPTVTMPNVVGMRLDDAHRALEALDVDNFDDTDAIGEEDLIFKDSNWVVVRQDPPAGTTDVDTGTTIYLSVGNEDDLDAVLGLIPADSDFAKEVAADETEEAEEEQREAEEQAAEDEQERQDEADEQAEAEEQRRSDAKDYASRIDEAIAQNVRGVFNLYLENASMVRESGGGPEVAASNAIAAQDFFDQAVTSMITLDVAPPDSLGIDGVEDDLIEAMALMSQACDELLVAIDTGAPSAFAREARLRGEAVDLWNAAVRLIYGTADRRPVLLGR